VKVLVTSMEGTVRSLEIPTKELVEKFIAELPTKLNKNHRVKVTCDLLGFDGYLQGTK
jgi:formylmethanofuran dehydrogenase subunit A